VNDFKYMNLYSTMRRVTLQIEPETKGDPVTSYDRMFDEE
jgi:hypothetical protein